AATVDFIRQSPGPGRRMSNGADSGNERLETRPDALPARDSLPRLTSGNPELARAGARVRPTMAEMRDRRPGSQHSLQRVTELLRKHRLVEGLVRRQEGPRQELVENLVQKLHFVELQKFLDTLHPADVAD